MISKEFLLGGDATFTLQIPEAFATTAHTPKHYTYRIVHKEGSNGFTDRYFASLLTGPDNTADYTYLGVVDPEGSVHPTKASKLPAEAAPMKLLNRLLYCIINGFEDRIQAAGFDVHHEGKCGRCGRKLTTPESIECGIGPKCKSILLGG